MRNIRLFVVTLLLGLFVVSANAQDAGTIVDVAAGNEDFSTLVELVTAAGLVDTLADESAEFTVFAPTNAAFEALPDFVVEWLGANPDVLTNVLLYHVVPGTVMAETVVTLDGETVDTALEGQSVEIGVDDMGVTVDGVMVSATDIEASNGVIHVLDQVILPDVELPEVDVLSVVGPIITAGSSTVGPLTERIATRWEEAGATDVPTIDIIGSGAGFERFCVAGETDISNASRPIRQSEIDSCGALEDPRQPIEFRVGTDALAVVVSSENDFIEEVTMEELAAIFSTATNWSDVRPEWPNEPISRFIPGTDSGTFDFFTEVVFDEDTEPILSASNLQQSEDDNVLETGIAGSPFAIGFFGYAYYVNNRDELNILTVDGVTPNATTAEDGSYPLARPLFIYSDPEIIREKPQVAALINFYLNNVNDEIVDVGYFPATARALNLARVQLLAAQAGFGGEGDM